ncbi:MAG TPA: hypothetical protein V6D10_07235 [Trichocoleus sp.]|jgi:hypothetical protein
MPDQPPECPIACPNRKTDGLTLEFGQGRRIHLDPFELLLYALMMLPAGVMVKEAFQPDYTFEQAVGRTTAIAALAWGIRKAPTEEIYKWLADKRLG